MASVVMQIAYAINQVLNHRATARDIIIRLLEKITHRHSRTDRETEMGTLTRNVKIENNRQRHVTFIYR